MAQNIAEFRIIGRIGKIEVKDKVTFIDVAANYNRQRDGEWVTETLWNRITCFARTAERANKAGKGDLVHITGRIGQNSYEKDGSTHYTVDLIADSLSVLAKPSDASDDQAGD